MVSPVQVGCLPDEGIKLIPDSSCQLHDSGAALQALPSAHSYDPTYPSFTVGWL